MKLAFYEHKDGDLFFFVRQCPNCKKFVKADGKIKANRLYEPSQEPNATCSKCGRVTMPYLGLYSLENIESIFQE